MKRYTIWAKRLLLIAGIIECTAGLFHFAMPYFTYQSVGFSELSANEISFVTLCVFAVGILLLAFGAVTIYLSFKLVSNPELLLFYVSIKSLLWFGRVLLEILYPVRLKFLFIDSLTTVVFPAVTFELLLFIVSLFLIRKITLIKTV